MAECYNMHYYYNVEYFSGITKNRNPGRQKEKTAFTVSDLSGKNSKILEYEYDIRNSYLGKLETQLKKGMDGKVFKEFDLKTIYPGLLIGLGNAHDLSATDCIKGGFSFDAMTGLPIISGSTLKGVLRSYFPDMKRKNYEEKELFIHELLGKEQIDCEALKENIFENNDIFIGGYPVIEKDKANILAKDYITHHEKPTKNPNPVCLLKVKPEVTYRFLFLLSDGGGISVEEKLELFKEILLIGGIGAKTNVGFGQMTE